MAKRFEYNIGPVCGVGRNKTEARMEAEDVAANVLKDVVAKPIHFTCGDLCTIVWRDVYGWNSAWLRDSTGWRHANGGSHRSYEDACDSALLMLAHEAYEHGDTTPRINLTGHNLSEFHSWREFQERYRHARHELGMNDNDAHSYAGRNPQRAELWAGELVAS